jgi:hypothetical protein
VFAAAAADAGAQATRTRDVGFATVAFDNGQTFGAVTLSESAVIERPTGLLSANSLLSLFNDGRWSMQGFLAGSRFSAPMAPRGRFARWFNDVRGELGLQTAATAQQGFMPTLQVTGETRLHLSAPRYATRVGASVARTFDGIGWRTTVMGEAGGWWQVAPRTVVALTTRPMQLQFGDLLGDTEGSLSWVRGRTTWDATGGVRVGEADKAESFWGSLTVTWPVLDGLFATAAAGSYPVDLIQGLPGGTYGALGLRLPGGRWALRRSAPLPPARRTPERPELPTTEPLALVIGEALDSLGIREIRVWAPGVREVEMLADFVDWIPVPLIRQPNGEWQGYYRVAPGLHRINLRLDGRELAVPRNLARVRDDFSGVVGLIVVK